MRQAIKTKFLGPTNYRGARVVAECDAKRIVIPWDHALDVEKNHVLAAKILAKKLGWGTFVSGSLKSGEGVHVFQVPEKGALADLADLVRHYRDTEWDSDTVDEILSSVENFITLAKGGGQ